MRSWKSWENETRTVEYQFSHGKLKFPEIIYFINEFSCELTFVFKHDRSRTVPFCKRHVVRAKTFEFLDQIALPHVDRKPNQLIYVNLIK